MALPPAIAAAFNQQAEFCRRAGSPLTGAVCQAATEALDATSATGRAIIGWPGEPMADALMMRFTGGCNALVRAGRAPEMAALYPPADLPDVGRLAAAMTAVFADPERDMALSEWLSGPPQTNEVGRSGVLMAGLMTIAAATGLPLRVFELGCSAGLNLNLDRFDYLLGDVAAGVAGSPVRIAPKWRGPSPPAAMVHVVSRRGTDVNPLDVGDPLVGERLMAFVWPDQTERVARAEAAIALAKAFPPPIDCADAADWVEAAVDTLAGTVAVVFHSIAWQYFPAATKARIAAHMAKIGAASMKNAPLAWLRFEMDDANAAELPTLRLTLWKGGQPNEHLLAHVHPHGSFISWQ